MKRIERLLRRGLNEIALQINRHGVEELSFMRSHQWDPPEEISRIQEERLAALLQHACRNVPYYRGLFDRLGLASKGELPPGSLASIPLLTKNIVRERSKELCSRDLGKRRWHKNRTSGSTGEPLALVQEAGDVQISGGSVLRWFYEWHGVRPGDVELKLWGSERDVLSTRRHPLQELRHRLTGVEILNAFNMTPEKMRLYLRRIDEVRPKMLRGYASNLYELARFAEENDIRVHPPGLVVSSAGTLYPGMRERMEAAFGCKVFNHYGSRDMHNMAMECGLRKGLHTAVFTHVIEVVDDEGRPCQPGQEGNIVVTSLTNYAQPLIRYCIGDRGAYSEERCACGRGMPVLDRISGRRVDCFRTRQGKVIPGEYFIYILGVFMRDTPFAKVQVIQEDYDHVVVNLVLKRAARMGGATRQEIIDKTRLVLGDGCQVEVKVVPEIPTPPSGKYPYTICKLPGAAEMEVR